jgi:hypothetical protein
MPWTWNGSMKDMRMDIIIWVMTTCSVVGRYQCFRRTYLSSADITLNITILYHASQCSLLRVGYTNFGEHVGAVLRQANKKQNIEWWRATRLRWVISQNITLWLCFFLQINRTWRNSYSVDFLGPGYESIFLCLENKENVNFISCAPEEENLVNLPNAVGVYETVKREQRPEVWAYTS